MVFGLISRYIKRNEEKPRSQPVYNSVSLRINKSKVSNISFETRLIEGRRKDDERSRENMPSSARTRTHVRCIHYASYTTAHKTHSIPKLNDDLHSTFS